MSNLYLLVKIGMQEQFKLAELKNRKNKSQRRNTLLLLIVILFLSLIIMGYAGGSAYGLVYMKLDKLIGPVALTITCMITLIFTMLKTNGILFGYHNYDTLASLPVRTKDLVASRFMQLYFPNLLFSILIMLPMGIVYGIFCKMGPLFYILWILSIPAAPLIPTTIAALLGVLIMAIASRMRHPQAVSALLSILLFVGIFVGSSFLGNASTEMQFTNLNAAQLMQMEGTAEKVLFSLYPVSWIFQQTLISDSLHAILYFILFLAGSYVWYLFFVRLTGCFYTRLQCSLTAHNKRHHAKELEKAGIYTQNTPLMAVFHKEWKRFLSSNIYLMNMGCGIIMVVLLCIALVFLPQDKIMEALQSSDMSITFSLSEIISSLAPFLIAGLLGMSCSSCCSLSLEGKSIEMLKSLPIEPATLYKGKILMNLTLLLPVSLICSLALSIRYGNSALQVLMLFIVPLVFSFFTAVWGMFANIHFPNYSWENETIAVKQSAAAFFGLFGGLLLAILSGILVFNLPQAFQLPATALVAVVILLLTWFLYGAVTKSSIPNEK
ncbi:MAG TPA: hypothetical protein VJY54_05655 [Lachnospiraceae bacterium]|nr:hypothetical protein [Lachnospiraceae bacterium]